MIDIDDLRERLRDVEFRMPDPPRWRPAPDRGTHPGKTRLLGENEREALLIKIADRLRMLEQRAEAERQAGKELGDALNAFAEGLEQALSRIDPKLEQLLYTFDPSALDTIKAMTRLREAAGQGHEYLSLRRGQQKKRSLAPETLLFGMLYSLACEVIGRTGISYRGPSFRFIEACAAMLGVTVPQSPRALPNPDRQDDKAAAER